MKDFLNSIELLSRRYSFSNVFDDVLTITISMFCLGRDEKTFNTIISRYEKEELEILNKAVADLISIYINNISPSGEWIDPLGDMFMENNSKFGAQARGQFFTPISICDLMAKLTYEHTEKELLVNDPTSGSARTLIAFDRCHPQNRFKNFYVAQDLDYRCVKMSVLNMYMHGMKGLVMHINTLTMECYGGYRIYLPDTLMGIKPLSAAEAISYYNEIAKEKQEKISAPDEILFDSNAHETLELNEVSVKQYHKQVQLKLFT